MFIDILYIILIVLAAIKGYSRGLIVAVFSFLAVVIGLAAALKLSATVAAWLNKSTSLGLKWLPFLAFLLIIIVVILLVRIGAGLLQKSVELVFAGWLNKLGGIILYACIYTMVYSVFIFYATQIHLLNTNAVAASSVYHFIEPWGPFCINLFGDLIPLFKGLFEELKTFFGKFAA